MEVVRAGGGKGRPEMGEKPHKHGMSLDIISPYLLPPGLHGSKESLRSLSKVVSPDDDKYRLAAQSDNASLHSYRSRQKPGQDDTSSSFAGSMRHGGPLPDDMNQGLLQHASQMSTSPPIDALPPRSMTQTLHEQPSKQNSNHNLPELDMPNSLESPNSPGHDDLYFGSVPERSPRRPVDSSPATHSHALTNQSSHKSRPSLGGFDFGTGNAYTENDHVDIPTGHETTSPSHHVGLPRLSLPMSETSDYGDEPQPTSPPAANTPEAKNHEQREPEPAHRAENRVTQSFTKFDEGFDPHRLTVAIRPLPPEDPSDNAEQRANRIRSFYKEYFDDSKGAAHEEYYEDFGPEFHNDPGVYDPYSGGYFTGPPKPFAQPMGRRAMTPPPRFQGPPQNILHPAAGSRANGPRAFSSASGRVPGPRAPSKPAPPPEPLHVLPSPHLIRDDMSVLPIDYAPAPSFKDRAEGRPESPRGGLRPYTSMSRAHTPLVSSFDDLAAIPSP